MRRHGRLVEWNDERGFGFVTPLNEDDRVFVHISEFPKGPRRPQAMDLVTFEPGRDDRDRPRASKVEFLTAAASPRQAGAVAGGRIARWAAIMIGSLTALVLISAFAIGTYAVIIFSVYTVMSLLTFAAYAMDKSAAQRGAFRTQESALHLMAFMGGWPGALLAQQRFRHKTRKQPFRTVFWATVALNVITLVILVGAVASSPG